MIAVATDKITIQEFLEMELEDGFRYELINGKIVKHPSSPSFPLQFASGKIFRQLDAFASDNDLGVCITAPFDVYFTDFDLYQPDIMFISNARRTSSEATISMAARI